MILFSTNITYLAAILLHIVQFFALRTLFQSAPKVHFNHTQPLSYAPKLSRPDFHSRTLPYFTQKYNYKSK